MQSGLELERGVDASTWNQTIHPSQYTRSDDENDDGNYDGDYDNDGDDDDDDDDDYDGDGGGGGGSFNFRPSKSINSIW